MIKMLLVFIYIAFIGLGLPDSLFGAAWPAIYSEFALPFSYGSFITATVSLGTVISSLFSAWIIKKLGTAKVSIYSTLLTAVALLGFSASGNLVYMVLLALPLGIGAGAIDVALNNYVATHYSARQMSFLHCFYGIGVSFSPYVLSLVMRDASGWRTGYRIAFAIQIAIVLLLILSLPLWKKADRNADSSAETGVKALSPVQALRIPGVKSMCALFFLTCAIECTCGAWASTYLVEYKHLSVDHAARIVFFYFVGMALGRFVSGLAANRLHSWKIIRISLICLGGAIALLLIPAHYAFSAVGLFLVGFADGPLFPNFNYLTPESFGEDVSQSIIGIQMAFAYIGILCAPPLCGVLGQTVGMGVFSVYLALLFVLMIPFALHAERTLKIR